MQSYKRFLSTILLIGVYVILQAQPPSNKPNGSTTPTPGSIYTPPGFGVGMKINYVRSWEAMSPITDPAVMMSAGYQDVKQATQYIDGLGRPLQMVNRQITPGGKDMVTPVVYDAFGRESHKFLPYVSAGTDGLFRLDPFNEQKNYLGSQYPGEQVFYSKTNFENSPLNRVEKAMSPGNSWGGSGRGMDQQYLINTAADGVRIWTISNNPLTYDVGGDVSTNIPASAITYVAGELYKNVTLDEAGKAVVEYTDKEGKIVLKKVQVGAIAGDYSGYSGFLCTYYVYDDLNQLRFVIPPKAVVQIQTNWQFTNDIINELCFRYEYDGRRRMIAKKVPGTGWVYMVYDVRDRLVFTQDAKLRTGNRWLATLYDGLNRPVMTGMVSYSQKPDILQQAVTTQTTTPPNPNTGMPVDLVLNTTTQGTYQALRSITMEGGFESTTNGELTAEIVGGTGGPDGETTIIEGMAVNKNPLGAVSNFIALTITFYDDYNWTNKTYTTVDNNKLEAGANLHAVAMPTAAHNATKGLVTGSKVRTIDDPGNLAGGKWLSSVIFYDDRGRVIQTQADNQNNGTDIATSLYDFTGKVLCSYLMHNNPASTATATTRTRTSLQYDHAGRLLKVWKTINDDAAKKALIVSNEYDELGQLKKKELGKKKDPVTNSYTSDPIEVLDYTYNVRGWLKGVNEGYANNSGPNANNRWFGMELNYDWGFATNQYNGNITGTKWRSKGDGERRAYGYNYDAVNRLMAGDFSQSDGTNYIDNGAVNFDMMMGNGQDAATAYDENGNIKRMQQWGLKVTGSAQIDDLRYTYEKNGISNKLRSVVDFNNDVQTKLGDFRTGASHPQQGLKTTYIGNPGSVNINDIIDYSYDENGNLKKDLNKDIGTGTAEAIEYNHLNLPWKIMVKKADGSEKGTITYTYDAGGNKLKKVTADKSVAGKTITTTTTYLGGMVYESKQTVPANSPNDDYTDKLQFISHEEGRTRYIPQAGQVAAGFEYDYFVKDHLGNVRMVLTEKSQQDIYPAATLEGNLNTSTDAAYIEKQFYAIDAANVVDRSMATGITDYQNNNGSSPINNNPNSNTGANSHKLYRLQASAAGGVAGLGMTLKVMSGDVVDIFGKSYYFQNNAGGTNYQVPVLSIINGILGTPGGATAGKGVTAGDLNGQSAITNLLNTFLQDPNRGNGGVPETPRAYINWMLLDENFKYVAGNFSRVGAANVVKNHSEAVLWNIPVTKNGYLYVYVNNESPVSVFFDNLQVVHTKGLLLEETHYYPFGLTMAGISTKAMGSLENKSKFNDGTELNTSFEIGLYETAHRLYDPQLGRFVQIDGIAEAFEEWAPYTFSFNNPILFNDPSGLAPDTAWQMLTPVEVVAKVPQKLDTENGQVYPVLQWWEYIVKGWGREWNGYEVMTDGYLTGKKAIVYTKMEIHDFGSKKAMGKGLAKGVQKWVIYKGYKNVTVNGRSMLKLYIGKAKYALSKRYTKKEIEEISAAVIEKLDDIPDNATALGVEQAVLILNGGVAATANIKNAAVKTIYLEAGRKWLDANIANWKEIFKFQ